MKPITILRYSNEILELIDDTPDVSRGDLQGIVEALVMKIISESQGGQNE